MQTESIDKDVNLEDLFLLKSLEDYFTGKFRISQYSSMLARNTTKKRIYIRTIRKHFKIPEYIPFSQFDRYLREIERGIKCRISKI